MYPSFSNKVYPYVILVIVGLLVASVAFSQTTQETTEGSCQISLQPQEPVYRVTNQSTGAGDWTCTATDHTSARIACPSLNQTVSNENKTVGSCQYYTGLVLNSNSPNRSCEKKTDNNFISKATFTCEKNYPYCIPQGTSCYQGDIVVSNERCRSNEIQCDRAGREQWITTSGEGKLGESCQTWLGRVYQSNESRVLKKNSSISSSQCVYRLGSSGDHYAIDFSDKSSKSFQPIAVAGTVYEKRDSNSLTTNKIDSDYGAVTQVKTGTVPDLDICPNIEGFQKSVPPNKLLIGGNCVDAEAPVLNIDYNEEKFTVTLNWTAVRGATGYKVYRAVGLGDFDLLAAFKSGSAGDGGTIKFEDPLLTCSLKTSLRYKVVPYAEIVFDGSPATVILPESNVAGPVGVNYLESEACASFVQAECTVAPASVNQEGVAVFQIKNIDFSASHIDWFKSGVPAIGCGDNASCPTGPLRVSIPDRQYSYRYYNRDIKNPGDEDMKTVSCPAVKIVRQALDVRVVR